MNHDDYTMTAALPLFLGGKTYGLLNDQTDTVPFTATSTDDASAGLSGKGWYNNSRYYGSWSWDARYRSTTATSRIYPHDVGHCSADTDTSTSAYTGGFRFFVADSGGSAQSGDRMVQGVISVYAIVKSDLDRDGTSATGGNEDFGG
jgi:hypothetical protein